ncbi:glycoside hydrolase [Flavisolibacter sp. BT320]|nr:glycoside hydrolase [Flavisolibacter longurius]
MMESIRVMAIGVLRKTILVVFICCALPLWLTAQNSPGIKKPLKPAFQKQKIRKPPAALKLDPFYKKYANADDIAIVSSEKVPDDALLVARTIVKYMLLKRKDIKAELINRNCMVQVMAASEGQTDLPEYNDMEKPSKDDERLTDEERETYNNPGGIGSMTDRDYWNERARGMGGYDGASCAEENLLGYKDDRYYGENILVHEFSHTIFSAIKTVDPDLYAQVEDAYEAAKDNGKYEGQYAINTLEEYWAEGTQWWFWSNLEFYDGETRVQSPQDLKAYDPTLYHLLKKVYAVHEIPADVYYRQNLRPAR